MDAFQPVKAVLFSLFCAAVTTVPAAAGAQTIEYAVLTLDKRSGAEVVTYSPRGRTSEFAFNDRGRGPELKSEWRVDGDGRPLFVKISGKSYMKTPADEVFEQDERGTASWSIGTRKASADGSDAIYLPLNAPPSYQAELASALLKAPGKSLALLPSGKASARVVAEERVEFSPGAARTVRAVEISGLDYEPQIVWLDQDNRLFADVSGWYSVVQAPAVSTVERLLEVQEEIRRKRRRDLAASLRQVPDAPVLIHNSRLFDPQTLQVTPATSVLVIGNRIAAVGPDGTLDTPANARRIDAANRFLMPGLWDNHVHMYGAHPILDLASGITTVRDMANDELTLPELEKRIELGEEIGPRILKAGFIDADGPFSGPTRARIKSLDDGRKWIDWYASHGYVQIKVYSSLDPAMVAPLAKLAHARGMRFSGHVPAHMTAQQFVEAGADELQHINFLFLNFLIEEAPDTRDTTRFTAVGRRAMDIDPAEPRVAEFIRLLAEKRIVVDPTINAFEAMYEGADDRVTPGYEAIAPRLPPTVARGMVGGRVAGPPEDQPRYARAMHSLKRMLKALHQAGVPLVPGSDSVPGFGLLRELELWSSAGIPNAEVLRAATLGSAQVNRRADDLGVVAPGKLADFVLVDGDPLRNISDLHNVRTVVKDGVAYDAAKLYRAVGVEPAQ